MNKSQFLDTTEYILKKLYGVDNDDDDDDQIRIIIMIIIVDERTVKWVLH